MNYEQRESVVILAIDYLLLTIDARFSLGLSGPGGYDNSLTKDNWEQGGKIASGDRIG